MGVHVIVDAFEVCNADVSAIEQLAMRGKRIFNPDGKRLQHALDRDSPLVSSITRALTDHGMLAGRQLRDPVALYSLPGCAQQAWHTDYDPKRLYAVNLKPMGVIAALQNATHFVTPRRTYKLDAGDLLCFDGDQVHAGSAYEQANVRFHAYLDVPAIKRRPDQTFLVTSAFALV